MANEDPLVTVPVSEIYVRPLPCIRDEHGEIAVQGRKRQFLKICEELYELAEAVIRYDWYGDDEELINIVEEAADVKTAVTTLEQALGIDEELRNDAQRRVNNRNRERGRL